MKRRFDLAVLGADSLVGAALLDLLAERRFPAGEVSTLGLDVRDGASVEFAGHALPLDDASVFDFSRVQLAFLADDDPRLAAEAERAADAGCVVVDAGGTAWRDPAIPRVVAGINDAALADFNERGIVSAPDRLLVPLLRVLAPVQGLAPLRAVTVTGLVPVSDGGRVAFQDLARETTALLNARSPERQYFSQQIAFNVHGQIGPVDAHGVTERERRIGEDLRRLLGQPGLAVSIHLVQVPLFYGYALTVDLLADRVLALEALAQTLATTPGVDWRGPESQDHCPSPVVDAMASTEVQVARLRQAGSPDAAALWITADNIRSAAASNAIDCAEVLVRDYL